MQQTLHPPQKIIDELRNLFSCAKTTFLLTQFIRESMETGLSEQKFMDGFLKLCPEADAHAAWEHVSGLDKFSKKASYPLLITGRTCVLPKKISGRTVDTRKRAEEDARQRRTFQGFFCKLKNEPGGVSFRNTFIALEKPLPPKYYLTENMEVVYFPQTCVRTSVASSKKIAAFPDTNLVRVRVTGRTVRFLDVDGAAARYVSGDLLSVWGDRVRVVRLGPDLWRLEDPVEVSDSAEKRPVIECSEKEECGSVAGFLKIEDGVPKMVVEGVPYDLKEKNFPKTVSSVECENFYISSRLGNDYSSFDLERLLVDLDIPVTVNGKPLPRPSAQKKITVLVRTGLEYHLYDNGAVVNSVESPVLLVPDPYTSGSWHRSFVMKALRESVDVRVVDHHEFSRESLGWVFRAEFATKHGGVPALQMSENEGVGFVNVSAEFGPVAVCNGKVYWEDSGSKIVNESSLEANTKSLRQMARRFYEFLKTEDTLILPDHSAKSFRQKDKMLEAQSLKFFLASLESLFEGECVRALPEIVAFDRLLEVPEEK